MTGQFLTFFRHVLLGRRALEAALAKMMRYITAAHIAYTGPAQRLRLGLAQAARGRRQNTGATAHKQQNHKKDNDYNYGNSSVFHFFLPKRAPYFLDQVTAIS